MGNRLHVAKKYRVEYADKATFNWKSEELRILFDAIGISVYGCDDENYLTTFECLADEFDAGLQYLSSFIEGGIDDEDVCEEIGDAVRDLCYDEDMYKSREEKARIILRHLQEYRDAADTNDDYLHFAFF